LKSFLCIDEELEKMKQQKHVYGFLLALIVGFLSLGYGGNEPGSRLQKTSAQAVATATTGKVGASYLFNINNFVLPMNNQGILAAVTINNGSRNVTLGEFQGKGVLFSGGFMMSGYTVDTVTKAKTVFANAVASASRVQDYSPGRWNSDASDDPQLYVVTRKDPDFGQSWQDWKDAVKLGASFYDGDHDGVYNPVDKNGNGKWDADEDRPDFVGDQVVWSVMTDKIISAQRRWTDQSPVGIDIQRTVFGFQSAGLLGNMLFVRYRIINRSASSPVMDSVFFSIWADPDVGDATNDLCGCDTLRNGGFAFNFGADNIWGSNPPCFFTDFFQGPVVYVPGETFVDNNHNGVFDAGDTPVDTAISVMGPLMGMQKIPGAKNLGLHSFVNYVQSDANRGDPATGFQAMNYTRGLLKDGTALNPCTDTYGSVFGSTPCAVVNPRYWYSGNVQTNTGWLYKTSSDIRIMQNIGPFKLYKDQPVDVVVAYIVGRGGDAISSVKEAQKISDFSQFLYDRNFAAPAPPLDVTPAIRTTESSIDLIWNTAPQVTYHALQYTDPPFNTVKAWDMTFEGYQVWMYRTNSTSDVEGGIQNSQLLAKYDIADKMDDILSENSLTGERTIIYQKGTQLDSNIYKDPVKGRLALRITTDPFTNAPLIKGHPYYFAITAYALDNPGLQPVDSSKIPGNYLLTSKSAVGGTGTFPVIFNGGVRPGIDFNDPYLINQTIQPTAGNIGDVTLSYDEMNKDVLTGNQYKVNFFKKADSSMYFMYWRLTNTTTNTVLLDSQKAYNVPIDSVAQKNPEGILLHVGKTDPQLGLVTYAGKSYTSAPYSTAASSRHNQWYKPVSADGANSGAFYASSDIALTQTGLGALPSTKGALMTANRMRNVEIRFGATQKAYRYIKGSFGGWTYAASTSKPGFVDVPFQVWVKDARYGEQRQLNCAFLETTVAGGKADGVWNPGFNLDSTKEYIVIFDRLYSPDSLVVYTGGSPTGTSPVWASISLGWTKPESWPSSYMSSADSTVAKNKWFDAMYIVGLARDTAYNFSTMRVDTLSWQNGDIVTVNVANYPIVSTDSFVFTTKKKGTGLSAADKVAAFERVTVYPNPLFAYNPLASYDRVNADNAFVTFSNLPNDVTIKIFSISGALIRTLATADKTSGPSSPFLNWNLLNQNGLRVASGMYIAVVSSPGLGEKILKLGIIMPQKQITQY
jgi:hypothetical protein